MTMRKITQAVLSVCNVPSSDQHAHLSDLQYLLLSFLLFIVLFLGLFIDFANSVGRTSS
jgi:hypothetical protein